MAKAASGRKKTATRKKTVRRAAGRAPTDITRVHIWQVQAVRDLLWVAAVIGLVWLGFLLRAVTVPLLVALLLAYLCEPLVARWSRTRSRTTVLVYVLCTAGVVIGLVVAVGTTLAVNQAHNLVRDIESGRFRQRLAAVHLPNVVDDTYHEFLDRVWPLPEDEEEAAAPGTADAAEGGEGAAPPLSEERIREIVREEAARPAPAPRSLAERWPSFAVSPRAAGAAALRVAGSVLQAGFLLFLIPFYFFFFSLWYPEVVAFGRSLLPVRHRERTLELLRKMDRAVAGFVRGRLVISAIMGVLLALGWMICGVPYSIALGIIVGIFCAIPYLGVIGVPTAILLLALDNIGTDGALEMPIWAIILWPTLVFVIVQAVEGYLLTPMIAGKATNLDPVTILVAVLAGGALMGVYGMLLAIPLAACLKIATTDLVLPKVKDWTQGRAEDPLPIERD